MNRILYRLGNWCFRTYVKRMGKNAAAATLIATLAWLRGYAEQEGCDFPSAVVCSRRRGTEDWMLDRKGFRIGSGGEGS